MSMLAHLAPAFSLGLLATLSPCVLPLYPGFLAYLAAGSQSLQQARSASRYLGLFVLAGVLTMMLALGALIAALSLAVGRVLAFVTPLADVIVMVLGILLLLNFNPFARLPQIAAPATPYGPYLNAFVYGLLYGPIALPCSGPLVVSVFSLSLGVTGFAQQLLFFLIFGLGFGLPLLALSLLARARQDWLLRQFTRHYCIISRLGGLVFIAVGAWDFWQNWPFLRLYLGL
jgi:cytochrome c-type biogenesis protein